MVKTRFIRFIGTKTDDIAELDKSRSANRKPALGGSLFSSSSGPSAPPEFQPLVALQITLSKASAVTASAVSTANTEYDKLTDPSKSVPTPPVYAARLSALLKNLSSAESAVSDTLKARRALIDGLEKIIETNKASIASEESQHATFLTRKDIIEAKKREVEDGIMRGLSAESSLTNPQGSPASDPKVNGRSNAAPGTPTDPDRPDVEELTPPPDARTPTRSPVPPNREDYQLSDSQSSMTPVPQSNALPPQAGADLLSSLNIPPIRQYSGSPGGGLPKRRRLDDEAAVFGSGGDAMADLDDDVAELLRQESGGR